MRDAWGEYASHIADIESGRAGTTKQPETVTVEILTGPGDVPIIPAPVIGRRGYEELAVQKTLIRKFLTMHYGSYIFISILGIPASYQE
jgi:hypothetical protein